MKGILAYTLIQLNRWLFKRTDDILLYYFSFLFQIQEFLILNDLFIKQEVNISFQVCNFILYYNTWISSRATRSSIVVFCLASTNVRQVSNLM